METLTYVIDGDTLRKRVKAAAPRGRSRSGAGSPQEIADTQRPQRLLTAPAMRRIRRFDLTLNGRASIPAEAYVLVQALAVAERLVDAPGGRRDAFCR